MSGKRIAGIIMTVFGGLIFLVGAFLLCVSLFLQVTLNSVKDSQQREISNFYSSTDEITHATGTVYAIEDGKTIVRFKTASDETYYATIDATSSFYDVGDRVTVSYDVEDPSRCVAEEINLAAAKTVTTFNAVMAVVYAIPTVVGLVVLIVGIVLIKKSKPRS